MLAGAALLGSIPFGLIVARLASGADVRRAGSGNIGATNVLRVSGPIPALLTLLLDAGKGAAAVLLALAVARGAAPSRGHSGAGAAESLAGWAGAAAVAGHVLSPWLGFRGGKGVATAAGALAALSPSFAAVGLGIFGIILVSTRIVSLASVLACVAMTLLSASRLLPGAPSFPVVLGISALIVIRHRANLARLARGEEPRLSLRMGPSGERR